ncbi:hypothetical protein [Conexibacter woesei]|uniref:hypothetical protein n=1 Tax=Conexibacter woesei TaxID=191495 RepID=UPI0011D1D188|nr:hypothetical protein [Conexibacter woesei]
MGVRTVVAVLVGTLVCSGNAAAASPDAGASRSTCPRPPQALALLGHPYHLESARHLVQGFRTRFGRIPRKTDPVLFVVSLRDGPMPATRRGIAALGNRPHGPGAILLVNVEDVPDPELQQLVLIETRDLLVEYRVRLGATMPVFKDDDPNIRFLLRGLVRCGVRAESP